MRLLPLVFAASLLVSPVGAQERSPSTSSLESSSAMDASTLQLPVSMDRIKEALEQQNGPSLLSLREQPLFRVQVQEKNRLDELIASLDFKAGPTPAGGLYAAEMQRQWFPATNNPLAQPYAAFSQPELLTILIENLAGKYLAGKALNAITAADRARAEAAAREEVTRSVAEYCASRPNGGSGVAICTDPLR